MTLIDKLKNKVEVINNATSQQLYWNSLARKISPAVIEEFPEYVLIDGQLMVRCLVVGIPPTTDIAGYPADMNNKIIDELLAISSEGHSIAFSYTILPISNVDAMKMLDNAMFRNNVAQDSLKKQKVNEFKKVLEQEDFAANYRNIYKNEQKMYHTAFIVLIWGMDRGSIREAESHVRIVLEANRVYYEFPDYRQLDTFLAAQPYPQWLDFTWIELFSYHAATLSATRNPNSRTDDRGLYFGDDIKTGKSIQIDLGTLAAQHLMFVGPTGSGKTFTLLMLLMRAYDILGKRIIYTTPKADTTTNYRNVAQFYGQSAAIIDIGPRGKNINPMQILYDEHMMIDDKSYERTFDEHLELLDQFFTVLFEGTKTINMSNYLNETFIQCYREKGIYRSHSKSWKDVTWPTLLDLREIWVNDAKDPHNVTAKALVDKTFMVTTSWSYMNRPTDINISADFIVVDISDVPTSLQDAMNVFVTGIMGMRFKTDTKKETIIAVDEAAVFLRHPKLSLFLLRTLTQGRSYKIALWLATQQTSDLIKANLEDEFKTNITISIILGNMRRDTLAHVKQYFNLDEHSSNDLLACGVGEGLLVVGNEIIPTKFIPTPQEIQVIKGKNTQIQAIIKEDRTSLKLVHDSLYQLMEDHGVCFSNWISANPEILSARGYIRHNVQKAVGLGSTNAWIKGDILNNNKILNQSIDHYCTVMQLAGWFKQRNIDITVNHYEDVDITAKINGLTVAFEYERPKSHDLHELISKKEFAEKNYDKVYFIGTSANINELSTILGESNVVSRGTRLEELLDGLYDELPKDELLT